MIRIIVIILEMLICFLLQTTVFRWFALAGIVPNLLLILTVSYGFMKGKIEGLIVGLACGFIIDLAYGNVLGLYAAIFMTIGFFIGHLTKVLNTNDNFIPILLVSISQLSYFLLSYIFTFLLRGRLNIIFYFITIGLPEIVYTTLVSIFAYRIINKIDVYLDGRFKKEA